MNILNRKVSWAIAASLLVASISVGGTLVVREHMKNSLRALNCTEASPEKVRKVIESELARKRYQPVKGDATTVVELRFNLAPSALEGVQMFVTSHKAERAVYQGPYADVLKVEAGSDLLEREGMDTFRFVFVDQKKGMICSGEQEVWGRVWRGDRPVQIEFLPYRELDPDIQTPIMWKIN